MRTRPCNSYNRLLLLLFTFFAIHSSERWCQSLSGAVEIGIKHATTVGDEDNDNSNTVNHDVGGKTTATITTTSYVRNPSSVSPKSGTILPSKKGRTMNILRNAAKRGLGGGISGGIAGCVQVITLMWLRTVINYQCRYGTTFRHAIGVLYREGGVGRLYQGIGFALVQAPMSKFFSTAANDSMQVLLSGKAWGIGTQTFLASIVVGCFRIILMPIDTCKVVLQVDGKQGYRGLLRRLKKGNIAVLYQGSIANSISSAMSNFPWFFIYNLLSKNEFVIRHFHSSIIRNGLVGLAASFVSDTIVNPLRVIKTTKQAMGPKHEGITYTKIIRMVLASDGWEGLLGRGLKTRMIANAIQSALFTIIWRRLADGWG